MSRVRIQIDWQNNAPIWWAVASEADAEGRVPATVAKTLAPLLDVANVQSIRVSPILAAAVEVWAASLEGWDDGHARAPHPLRFHFEED